MKCIKLLSVILVAAASSLVAMQVRPGRFRQVVRFDGPESRWPEEKVANQPVSLTTLSIKSLAQNIDNNKITLDQAKKFIPVELHPQLEAEVQRLRLQSYAPKS